ncbi:MAG: GNAT family N-acetyltransferase [Pseudomonadota bacterium]
MIALDVAPLSSERLTLRAPSAMDWTYWERFITSERSRFVGGPRDRDSAWRAFGHIIGHWVLRGYGVFVFCLKGEDRPLGMAGPWHPIVWPEPEISWSVWDSAVEGTGLAYDAARATRLHAYETLGWPTAVSYIDEGNTRSIRLAERLGARPDPGADRPPSLPGEAPCTVYRHPHPEMRP